MENIPQQPTLTFESEEAKNAAIKAAEEKFWHQYEIRESTAGNDHAATDKAREAWEAAKNATIKPKQA